MKKHITEKYLKLYSQNTSFLHCSDAMSSGFEESQNHADESAGSYTKILKSQRFVQLLFLEDYCSKINHGLYLGQSSPSAQGQVLMHFMI